MESDIQSPSSRAHQPLSPAVLDFVWQQAMDDTVERRQLETQFTAKLVHHLPQAANTSPMASGAIIERWQQLDKRIAMLCGRLVEESFANNFSFTDKG